MKNKKNLNKFRKNYTKNKDYENIKTENERLNLEDIELVFEKQDIVFFSRASEKREINIIHCSNSFVAVVPKQLMEEAQKTKDKLVCIDITKYGYHIVLGKGVLPKVPVVIKAKFFSREAERRVKAVGGA